MKAHTTETVVAATKKLLVENSKLAKKEAQIYFMAKQSLSWDQAFARAVVLYEQMQASMDSALGFGPYYGLNTDEPQWETTLSVGSMKAKFLCGVRGDGETYLMADIRTGERERVVKLLEAGQKVDGTPTLQ